MKNTLAWTYGITAYLIAFISLILFALFTLNLFIPFTVDKGGIPLRLNAWLVNSFWIALFGVQHSVMARRGFKRWLHTFINEPFERATYLVFSSLPLLLLVTFWQPIQGTIWHSSSDFMICFNYGVALLGWSLVVASTFAIDHFDLFGLRQIYFYTKKRPYVEIEFKTSLLYRVVRHPMQLGVVLGIWFTPTMTLGHLFLSVGMTAYILVGLYFEERDLVIAFQERYREYQRTVPKLIPRLIAFSRTRDI